MTKRSQSVATCSMFTTRCKRISSGNASIYKFLKKTQDGLVITREPVPAGTSRQQIYAQV